ncbi:MAG TPA: hypothetical protein VHS09_10840 [Polyangiaceae bacterium]|nr:hypothetical protein [Polyangiaceae bacterium]
MRPRAPSLPSAPPSASPDTTRLPVGVDYREEMPTYSDPVELEAARIKSTLTSTPPPARPPREPSAALTDAERLAVYELRFGGFDRVPVVVVGPDTVAACELDSRASMLLPLLDGRSTIRDVLDIGLVNALDTLAGLAQLLERGVIGFKDGASR